LPLEVIIRRDILNIILKDKPIIRKAETGCCIKWTETKEQLSALGKIYSDTLVWDVAMYRKLLSPKAIHLIPLKQFSNTKKIHYEKYANNYDYNKAVF
jgi:hypothetical protein